MGRRKKKSNPKPLCSVFWKKEKKKHLFVAQWGKRSSYY